MLTGQYSIPNSLRNLYLHNRFCPRVSSLTVMGTGVVYGMDGATVELIGLEKVQTDILYYGFATHPRWEYSTARP